MGTIRGLQILGIFMLLKMISAECGGKMHLAEESWHAAYEDFFEAFKNYDESGSPRRINCLKMLVLVLRLNDYVLLLLILCTRQTC